MAKVHWRGSIHTPHGLRSKSQHLNHKSRNVEHVVTQMRDCGLALHLSREKSGDLWWLSDGSPVTTATAKLAIAHPNIVSVGDGLFHGAFGQTYRHI